MKKLFYMQRNQTREISLSLTARLNYHRSRTHICVQNFSEANIFPCARARSYKNTTPRHVATISLYHRRSPNISCELTWRRLVRKYIPRAWTFTLLSPTTVYLVRRYGAPKNTESRESLSAARQSGESTER